MEGCKFSGGRAKANLILSAGILQRAWTSISELERRRSTTDACPFVVDDTSPNSTTLVFLRHHVSAFIQRDQRRRLPLQTHPHFDFLTTNDNPSVSFNGTFLSVYLSFLQSTDFGDQACPTSTCFILRNNKQLIIVGEEEGGATAALCALWLLKNWSSPSLPLCITFDAPFVGGEELQKAVGTVEQWTAQFWHVTRRRYDWNFFSDSGRYKPFGTYFLISDSGCVCVDDPDSACELLQVKSPSSDGHFLDSDHGRRYFGLKKYGMLRKKLEKTPLSKSRYIEATGFQESLMVDLALQLDSAGIGFNHEEHQRLLQSMKQREVVAHLSHKSAPNASKRLNQVKKQMARLEWYKKECEAKNMTYYDCYKSRSTEKDMDVIKFKNILNNYWREKVEEAEDKPQLPDARMRVKWLFAGVTYKRMVEPLDIADHYRRTGRGDYTARRPRHYELLEKWYEEDDKKNKKEKKKEGKGTSLTDDSCFWAHVEEAALRLNELKKQGRIAGAKSKEDLWNELREFEGYVMKSVDNYELSPEVFLDNSSFMEWWKEYEKELEPGYSSPFVAFMKDTRYVHYK
ncbi:Senescence-associated carboxylesterase 101 [Nymphaea thermarum]|nr:Senescence-associated carboxylesterase 101 [Nymphaea thermarum]